MENARTQSGRLGGLLLAIGGAGFVAAGVLHPTPAPGINEFHGAMTSMLGNPLWPVAHWIALATGLVLTWALWLLMDHGWMDHSVAGRAGARLALISTLFMSVQWAVEIAARSALEGYSRGEAAPMIALIDAMQAIGWPALALGFGLLAAGVPAASPRWLAVLAMTGAAALGLAGLLAQGLHILQAGVLFLGGHLVALWMIWSGIRTARSGSA